MIHESRANWFGASDTNMVLASNRNTKTFKQFWAVKMGEQEPDFKGSFYTEAGNKFEHPILKTISEEIRLDYQIKIEKLKLRVNYDGDKDGIIYEVKTHRADIEIDTSGNSRYWRQCQVEMYAYKTVHDDFKRLYIVDYPLYPDEYKNSSETPPVDFNRIKFIPIEYDKHWIKTIYLPKLKELARCLQKGKIPK